MVDTRPLPLRSPPPPSFAPSPIGFGDYELLEHVGRGGMAEVWLARRPIVPGGHKPCALKIIRDAIAATPRGRRMFQQETRLALKLRHANLVSGFDAGEVGGRLFMALEWIDGIDLRRFLDYVRPVGPLPIPIVCHIIAELLQGLRYAHGLTLGERPLGVVHRDISPHNVLVSAAGEIKLTDFGIARVVGESSSGLHIKGRARYMAPEQLRGAATQASDLFAVGALLHELLDGRRFRERLRRAHGWHRVVSEAALPPLERADVPPALDALRAGLLQADPSRRIATAEQAIERLMHCPRTISGAHALRVMYERHVSLPRRTGLVPSGPAPRSRIPTARSGPAPGAARHALREPTMAPAARSRASTRTLWPRSSGRSPSGTPSRTRRTARAPAGWPVALRVAGARALWTAPWLERGLWALAAILALIATILATILASGPARARAPHTSNDQACLPTGWPAPSSAIMTDRSPR